MMNNRSGAGTAPRPYSHMNIACLTQMAGILFGLAALLLPPAAVAGQSCGTPAAKTGQEWRIDNSIAFKTRGLAVDADGAPNSYLVDGMGLSDTCDGVVAIVNGKRVTNKSDPQHWLATCRKTWADAVASGDYSQLSIFGFLTDKQNRPLVQADGDPLPGKAYITTTTLTVPNTPAAAQRHWVDAVQIPYIVLPTAQFRKDYGVRPGDVAEVFRPKTGVIAAAVFADCCGVGEGSVKLHRDLGNEPVSNKNGVERANRGIDDLVFTLVFPGVNVAGSLDAAAWNRAIHDSGNKALEKWGGKNRLEACAK